MVVFKGDTRSLDYNSSEFNILAMLARALAGQYIEL